MESISVPLDNVHEWSVGCICLLIFVPLFLLVVNSVFICKSSHWLGHPAGQLDPDEMSVTAYPITWYILEDLHLQQLYCETSNLAGQTYLRVSHSKNKHDKAFSHVV